MQRDRLLVPVEFYLNIGENTYEGGTNLPLSDSSVPALVSWGGGSYDATRDPNALITSASQGAKSGKIRVLIRSFPEGALEAIKASTASDEAIYLLIPSMSDRFFVVTDSDLRGQLPGGFPYRFEAEAS